MSHPPPLVLIEKSAGVTTVTTTLRYLSTEARDKVLRSPMEQGRAHNFENLDRLLVDERGTKR